MPLAIRMLAGPAIAAALVAAFKNGKTPAEIDAAVSSAVVNHQEYGVHSTPWRALLSAVRSLAGPAIAAQQVAASEDGNSQAAIDAAV